MGVAEEKAAQNRGPAKRGIFFGSIKPCHTVTDWGSFSAVAVLVSKGLRVKSRWPTLITPCTKDHVRHFMLVLKGRRYVKLTLNTQKSIFATQAS